MPVVDPNALRLKIKKIYADSKKANKFTPPSVARAMALAMLAKDKKKK